MDELKDAESIFWDTAGGIQMSITPDVVGTLRARVENGAVTIVGTNCRHTQGDLLGKPTDVTRQLLEEVHMTVLSSNCVITWKAVVAPVK